MKANFDVDPDFPIIDGVGHSDKIDFFNVKGGGSTNTTLFDCGYGSDHSTYCARRSTTVATSRGACALDPDVYINDAGATTAGSSGCLNPVFAGDSLRGRCSDRICLNRIEVSGVLHRAAGTDEDDYSSIATAPKVAVFLVLDTHANGAVLAPDRCLFAGGSFNSSLTNLISSVPLPVQLNSGACVPESRFRILASDVIDFALNPETRYDWLDYADTTTTEGGPLPVPETTTIVTRTRYSFWRSVSLGFRFDVDLGAALCQYLGDDGLLANCSDLSLHLWALCFDGVNMEGYTPHAFGRVECSYMSRLWFSDWLAPRSFTPAGADGGPVPDEEVPLAILADQSAAMAGDGTFLERPVKRSKASHGFFNFRPRSGDAMLFEDDPEFARLQRRKGDSRSRVRDIVQRRFKSHKYDDEEDFYAREGDRGGKRGKY